MTAKPRYVAGALVRDGRVLLCHRSETRASYPGVWDLPGGHVEPDEDEHAALLRELAEELGIAATLADDAVGISGPDWELTVFPIRSWRGIPHNADPHEHDQLAWFDPGQMEPLALADRAYLPLLSRFCREAS